MQEEQERQEAIEELQATFMGHQARQPVVKALQVRCSKLKKKNCHLGVNHERKPIVLKKYRRRFFVLDDPCLHLKPTFLAVQDSSIGDIVSQSVSQSLSHSVTF